MPRRPRRMPALLLPMGPPVQGKTGQAQNLCQQPIQIRCGATSGETQVTGLANPLGTLVENQTRFQGLPAGCLVHAQQKENRCLIGILRRNRLLTGKTPGVHHEHFGYVGSQPIRFQDTIHMLWFPIRFTSSL